MSLLLHEYPESINIISPEGIEISADVWTFKKGNVMHCDIIKDGGDDVDITDGTTVNVAVELIDDDIIIDGGIGVGRVTLPGLDQPVGAAAINSVPRKMIKKEVIEIAKASNYKGGFRIIISIPKGEELASKTFNPKLGIVGGISVLGTSGIVRPQSVDALKKSIEVEMNVMIASGSKDLTFIPGNYAEQYISGSGGIGNAPILKCSNYIGDVIDMALEKDVESILLIGHIGKLVKLASGIMNTHSRFADGRREVFCTHAALAGAGKDVIQELFNSATSDACIDILKRENIDRIVMDSILDTINELMKSKYSIRIGVLTFSLKHGYLGKTQVAEELIKERIKNEG